MIVTEAEALTKTCPQGACKCGGSRCMAWRWYEPHPLRDVSLCPDPTAESEPPRPSVIPQTWTFVPFDDSDGEGAFWIEPEASAAARRYGFCGLAGMPGVEV